MQKGFTLIQLIVSSSIMFIVVSSALLIMNYMLNEKTKMEYSFDTLNHAVEVRMYLSESTSCKYNLNDEHLETIEVPSSVDIEELEISVNKITGGAANSTLFEVGELVQRNFKVKAAVLRGFQRISLDSEFYFAKLQLTYDGIGKVKRVIRPREIPLRVQWKDEGGTHRLTDCVSYGFDN